MFTYEVNIRQHIVHANRNKDVEKPSFDEASMSISSLSSMLSSDVTDASEQTNAFRLTAIAFHRTGPQHINKVESTRQILRIIIQLELDFEMSPSIVHKKKKKNSLNVMQMFT